MTAAETPAWLAVGGGRFERVSRLVEPPGAGDLLVDVRANALCGSDRGVFAAGGPVVPGHEVAGVVHAAGPSTTTPVGTPGVVYLMQFCGTCRSCRAGATHQCLAKQADIGFTRDGGLGSVVRVTESAFFGVGDVPLDDATLLLDVLGTTGHALDRARSVRPDLRLVGVAGTGPIGLGLIASARLRLDTDTVVLAWDTDPRRLELAEELGAEIVDPDPASIRRRCARTGEHVDGLDLAVDTTGTTGARQDALTALASRRAVLVCVGHGQDLHLQVSSDLIATERSVLGSEYFPRADLPAALDLLRAHPDELRRIITDRFPIENLPEAVQAFDAGAAGKVVLTQEAIA